MKHSTPSRRAEMSRKLGVVPGYMVVDDDNQPEHDPENNTPSSKEGAARPSMADISAAAMRFTARQWTCLVVFGLADLASAMVVSIQAPFYPAEVTKIYYLSTIDDSDLIYILHFYFRQRKKVPPRPSMA